ncbi:MAG: hypothetical protein ACTHV8_05995 [Nesterenkonia sp.]
MSIFPNSDDEHADDQQQPQPESTSRMGAAVGWTAVLVLTAVAVVVAIWQVNEQLYTAESTVEQYWEALAEGDGAEAMGHISAAPDFLAEEGMDHLLLDAEGLTRSTELIEAASVSGDGTAAQLDFTVGTDEHSTSVPVTHSGTTWGFFDTWGVSTNALTWFEVAVPGAPQGGIHQVQVNGEPVNLNEETTRLSAFVPSAAEIAVDSEWLVGSASHVVTAPEDDESTAERVTLDLEASEAATEMLHEEIAEYFSDCNQPVLMPTGCSVGTTTPHRVSDSDSIEWSFPEPDEFSLSFDDEGWSVSHDELVAEVSFDAVHHFSGEQLTQTEEVPFDLDIQMGASGEDLIVSVAGA